MVINLYIKKKLIFNYIMNNLIKNTIIIGDDTLKYNEIKSNSWWYPSKNGNKRIMICGTYPIGQTNGYSRVMYYISKFLGAKEDIDLTIYGFQNFNQALGQNVIRNEIPSRVKLHDAYETEQVKRNGFGEKEIGNYIKSNPQDIIIIFNDAIITSAITQTIINECGSVKNKFKLVSYMDQVYLYQKKDYINLLNTYFDSIIAFTPYWRDIAYTLGIKKSMPIHVFPHGFDHKLYYPIPQNIARMFYSYDDESFMALNLNRNQPRKRWDITLTAWAEFIEKHYNVNITKKITKTDCKINKYTSRPVKLIVGTSMDAYWNFMDVLENEVKFRDVPWEYVKNTIVSLNMPQQLSDRDINIIYNACDVGITTSDGEGFGLCPFEHLALGKPQICSYVGGMREFLNENISTVIIPNNKIYLDNKNGGIGGFAELIDPHEVADALWKYFSTPELAEKHGFRGRQHILTHYRWDKMVDYFYREVIPKL